MGWETQAQAPADTACTLIPKGSGRMDGASLAQMSWASGLHSGAAPQISATEGPQKAARFIGGLRELCMAWPLPPEFHVSQGADNPRKGLLPEPRTVQSALSSRLLLIPSSAQESPYWAPGFRSNVPLKGPDGTLCPWVCMTPDPACPAVLLEATACPTPGGRAPTPQGPPGPASQPGEKDRLSRPRQLPRPFLLQGACGPALGLGCPSLPLLLRPSDSPLNGRPLCLQTCAPSALYASVP